MIYQQFSWNVQNETVRISCYVILAAEGDEVVPEGLTSYLKLKVATPRSGKNNRVSFPEEGNQAALPDSKPGKTDA